MAEEVKAAEAKPETDAKADEKAGTQQNAEQAGEQKTEEPKIPAELQKHIEKLVQSETDKVRTKYSRELKEKDAALEAVKKEKMTAEERAKYEEQKAKDELAAERRQVAQAKLELHAIKRLSESELGQDALSLVMADSEEAVEERIKTLKSMLTRNRKTVAEEILKTNGRTVAQSPISGGLYSLDQLKAMSQKQIEEIMATPEGEKRIRESYAAGVRR